jgi:iron complex transport system permease protein
MTPAAAKYQIHPHNAVFKLLLLSLLIIIFFVLNITIGSVMIPPGEIVRILTGHAATHPAWEGILLSARLPQALTAMFAGAALGVAGLIMQTLFRNPLAGPSVLGISSGASLGVAVMMLFITMPAGKFISISHVTGNFGVVVAAFAGAFGVLLLIMALAARFRSPATILIIGIMIAYAVTAIVGILQFYSLKEDLQAFVIWGLGSFANVSWQQLAFFIPLLIIGIVLALLMIKPLNALLLGENYARNLGVNTRRISLLAIFTSGLLIAVVTAYCGPIAFLGLAVPHFSRALLRSSNHLLVMPGTLLSGMALALLCNLIARLPGFDGALPINAITSLIGAPVVVWIILRRNQISVSQ